MEILPNDSLSQVTQYLGALSQRQQLISANVANAHTPGYTGHHVSFAELLQSHNPFETRLSQAMGGKLDGVSTDTGRPVDLQREMVDMQKNLLFYSVVTRRASTIFSSLKAASQTGR